MLQLPGYKIDRQIGKGGMARVYLAVHEGLHREVAIKVMSKHLDEDAGFGERFMREARIVASLNHQNIVTVFDVNTHDGYHYIAMEYLSGGVTLDHKIKQGLTPADGVVTIQQVAAALGYAHGKGIIHRDVKPENIMYREDGSAVLTDFGIARSTTTATKMTATGTVIGTPHYMSPEQAQGEELGPGADIYSLGVVFYETLTGEVPYDADSSIAIVFKHIADPVPTLDSRLAVYQPVLDRMMAKDKESRYQDCADIITDLDSLVSGRAVSKETLINNATAINPATPAAIAAIKKATGKPGVQDTPAKKKMLIPALAATILVVVSAAGYMFYAQNQAVQEQQRLSQNQQQQELVEEKQQLASKLAAEKQKADKLKAEQLAAQNKTAEQTQEQANRLAEQEKAAVEQAELERNKAEVARQEKLKAEQAAKLATLERNKAEAARQEKLKAEQQQARSALQKKINDLFASAESNIQKTRLKGAYRDFQAILKLEPGNARAESGITRVADRYLALARTAALANDFDQANSHISSAIQIAPTHDKLGSTQQEIFALKDAQLAKQAEAQRAQQEPPPKEAEPAKKRRTFGAF